MSVQSIGVRACIWLILGLVISPCLQAQRLNFKGQPGSRLGETICIADLDGNGTDDLLVSAPQYEDRGRHKAGAIYALSGSKSALKDAEEPAWSISKGTISSARFGASMAVGDVNGDGKPEVLIGAPGLGKSMGGVYLLPGSAALSGENPANAASVTILGSEIGALGRAVALGDLNGDGLADLVVSEPFTSFPGAAKCGRVLVFLGRKSWKKTKGKAFEKGLTPQLIVVGREHEGLGETLLTEDLNGDGIADLIIGSPSYRKGRGAVTVVLGSRSAFKKQRQLTLDQDEFDLLLFGSGRFGQTLSALNLDGTGPRELLIGAPLLDHGRDKEAGAIAALEWSDEAKKIKLTSHTTPKELTLMRGLVGFERFGGAQSRTTGFGQATEDLLVGSPGAQRVVVFADIPGFDPAPPPSTAKMASGATTKGFGEALGGGDLDADGKMEIIVGAPKTSQVIIY